MLGTVLKVMDLGWGIVPCPLRNLWLDILFGMEEPFDYVSVTVCPDSSSS